MNDAFEAESKHYGYPIEGNRADRVITPRTTVNSSRWNINDLISLVIGLLGLFYLRGVGQLYISEILLILLAPLLWWQKGHMLLVNMDVRKILGLGMLWFFSQVITDFIRETPLLDIARGWSGILVLLICFSSLYLLLGNNIRRIKIFTWGYAVSGLISIFFQPSPFFSLFPWKFGYGQPVILLAFLIVIQISRGQLGSMRKWSFFILLLGIFSFYLNARSLGAFTILSAVILWLRSTSLSKGLLARARPINLFATGLLLALIMWGVLSGYAYLAEQGVFGENAKYKFDIQSNGSILGVVLGGRVEILASSRAILDSPIIGHGSWAKGPEYRLFIYQVTQLGYQYSKNYLDYVVRSDDSIPTHSHITQSWVWSGLLGAIFWVWVFAFTIRAFLRENFNPGILYPLVIYFTLASIWDILFSPFGSIMRVLWALRFVTFLSARRLD